MRRVPLLLAVCLQLPATSAAQLLVSAERDLDFGSVFQGVQSDVDPSDPIGAGRFRIEGPRRTRISIDISWPAGLSRVGGGATLPFTMVNRDAAVRNGGNLNRIRYVNPGRTINRRLDNTGFLYLDIGGVVAPTTTQSGGDYAGPIIITVSVL